MGKKSRHAKWHRKQANKRKRKRGMRGLYWSPKIIAQDGIIEEDIEVDPNEEDSEYRAQQERFLELAKAWGIESYFKPKKSLGFWIPFTVVILSLFIVASIWVYVGATY